MQELKQTLDNVAETNFGERMQMPGYVPLVETTPDGLDETAQRWAAYCLKEMRGNALARGLDISRAIAEFVAELKHPTA